MISLLRKVGVCVVFLLCLVWYGSTHFYRDPGSIFFDKTRAFEQRYSKHRKAEVHGFIEKIQERSETGVQYVKAGKNATLCVSFSSVNRRGSTYLETTIASLLHRLTAAERRDLYVNILNAEANLDSHPAWHTTWLHNAVDRFESYSFTGPQEKEYVEKLSDQGSYAEKGVYDYTTALQRCLEVGAPYVAMFEDDILMADGWMMQTLAGLDKIPPTDDEQRPWLFMRLFNQERSMGWAGKNVGDNDEYPIIFGIAAGVSLITMLLRRRLRWARKYFELETMLVVTVFLIPALVILFYQCGKASLLPPSPGVFDEPYGCCSQALIFPRSKVPLVLEYLQEKRTGQFDLLLDDLAVEVGLTRYALYPVQAQHIGLESARMTERHEAQAIWSMAYEDLDPKALKVEHSRLTRLRYGE